VTVTCRPETPDDEPFVRQLAVDTIAEELGAEAWPELLRAQVIGLQYESRRSRASASGDGNSQIIVANGESAGWLLTSDLEDEIWISEIMVLADRRGRGVGSAAIGLVLSQAAAGKKPVRLVVNHTNARARRIYEKLGFQAIETNDVQQLMQWTP
jgi:ribosomal protein S18 acetylase RimI-like enzyme